MKSAPLKSSALIRSFIFILCLLNYTNCYSNQQYQGVLFILSGPSGVGKTTLGQHLIKEIKDIEFVVTYTTRKRREGEVDGKDYYFVDKKEFNKLLKKGCFLTHATIHGKDYGLPVHKIEDLLKNNKKLLLSLNWEGNQKVKDRLGNRVVSIFITPPGLQELERRIRLRSQNTEDDIKERIRVACEEMSHSNEYDYVIQNDNFNKTIHRLKFIIKKHSKNRF